MDQNASEAIDNENNTMLKNRNIIVRCAALKGPGNKGNFNKNNQNQKDRDRSRSPGLENRNSGGGGGPRNQKSSPWSNDNKNNNNNGYFGGNNNNNSYNSNNNNNNNSFNSSVPSLLDLPTPMNVDNNFNPDYNDCEIIVVSRALT